MPRPSATTPPASFDAPINRLLTLKGSAVNGWTGFAGDTLVCAVDTRRQSLVQAQGQLHDAATRLRSAAARLREPRRPRPGTTP